MSLPESIVTLLASHLSGLEEAGRNRLRLDGPLPRSRPPAPPAAPKPRQVVSTPKPLPPDPEPEILPKPKVDPVAPASAPARLSVRILHRMPECEDAVDPANTRLALITEAHELEEKNGELLDQMLKAIGYAAASADEPFREGDSLADRGARVLVMGNTALQIVSPAGMDLGIVRGMWQQSPHGKLISTFAPSYLQDNPAGKKAAWKDLQSVLKDVGVEVPAWTRRRLKK